MACSTPELLQGPGTACGQPARAASTSSTPSPGRPSSGWKPRAAFHPSAFSCMRGGSGSPPDAMASAVVDPKQSRCAGLGKEDGLEIAALAYRFAAAEWPALRHHINLLGPAAFTTLATERWSAHPGRRAAHSPARAADSAARAIHRRARSVAAPLAGSDGDRGLGPKTPKPQLLETNYSKLRNYY